VHQPLALVCREQKLRVRGPIQDDQFLQPNRHLAEEQLQGSLAGHTSGNCIPASAFEMPSFGQYGNAKSSNMQTIAFTFLSTMRMSPELSET
jgi:hypothetical protein